MINLCILEDNLLELKILESYVTNWSIQRSKELNIKSFTKVEDLNNNETIYGFYDGFLLDIELPDGNGMELANDIRKQGYQTPLAFITSNDSFVFKGYDVSAISYILKPINQDSIFKLMDNLYSKLPEKIYTFENHGVTHAINYKEIIYFESQGHYIELVTSKENFRHRKNISTLIKELGDDFCQCYRTIAVNIAYVKTLQGSNVVLLNNKTLPLGKKFVESFKKAYFKFHLKK